MSVTSFERWMSYYTPDVGGGGGGGGDKTEGPYSFFEVTKIE